MALAGLNNLKLVIAGGLPSDESTVGGLEVAGADLGKSGNGLIGNFALDTLQVGDASNLGAVALVNQFANQASGGTEALYVKTLRVKAGSKVYIGNGVKLYYQFGDFDIESFEGGDLIQIPEPATLGLFLAGAGLAGWRKRRSA